VEKKMLSSIEIVKKQGQGGKEKEEEERNFAIGL